MLLLALTSAAYAYFEVWKWLLYDIDHTAAQTDRECGPRD